MVRYFPFQLLPHGLFPSLFYQHALFGKAVHRERETIKVEKQQKRKQQTTSWSSRVEEEAGGKEQLLSLFFPSSPLGRAEQDAGQKRSGRRVSNRIQESGPSLFAQVKEPRRSPPDPKVQESPRRSSTTTTTTPTTTTTTTPITTTQTTTPTTTTHRTHGRQKDTDRCNSDNPRVTLRGRNFKRVCQLMFFAR